MWGLAHDRPDLAVRFVLLEAIYVVVDPHLELPELSIALIGPPLGALSETVDGLPKLPYYPLLDDPPLYPL